MTIDSIDVSVQTGAPIHLFEILFENIYYRFTNHPNDIDALGYTWESKNIALGTVELTEDINKNNLQITFPRDDTFARSYLTDIQDSVSTVTVYRGYQNDPDAEFLAYWKGRYASNKINKNQITFICESIFTSMKRPGIRGKFSKHCRHALYGRGCNLDIYESGGDAVYTETDAISVSVDGLTYQFIEAGLQSDGYYLGGMLMHPDGNFRFIRSHTGEFITISRAFNGEESSDFYRLYPGCDRTMTTCKNRFNNLENYGGFPYTPDYNPMGGGRLR